MCPWRGLSPRRILVSPAGRLFRRSSRTHRGVGQMRDSYNGEFDLSNRSGGDILDDLALYRPISKNCQHARVAVPRIDRWLSRVRADEFFIPAKPTLFAAKDWLQKLRDHKDFVRYSVRRRSAIICASPSARRWKAKALVKAVRCDYPAFVCHSGTVSAKKPRVYLEFYGLRQSPSDITLNPPTFPFP